MKRIIFNISSSYKCHTRDSSTLGSDCSAVVNDGSEFANDSSELVSDSSQLVNAMTWSLEVHENETFSFGDC